MPDWDLWCPESNGLEVSNEASNAERSKAPQDTKGNGRKRRGLETSFTPDSSLPVNVVATHHRPSSARRACDRRCILSFLKDDVMQTTTAKTSHFRPKLRWQRVGNSGINISLLAKQREPNPKDTYVRAGARQYRLVFLGPCSFFGFLRRPPFYITAKKQHIFWVVQEGERGDSFASLWLVYWFA